MELSRTRRVCIFGLLLWLSFFVLSACEKIEEEQKEWEEVERPQMLFTDTTLLDSYDKDALSWKLKTAYLERWADKEVIYVRPVLVDIYDSTGERVAFLRADSGRLDMKFTYVYAYGHVYAITPKGASVRADSLLWNKKTNLVKTDSYVRVVSEDGDVLQGKGFESDAKMDNWKIISDVTGIFQDAATRIKEEDKQQAAEIEKKDSAKVEPVKADSIKSDSAKAAPAKTNSANADTADVKLVRLDSLRAATLAASQPAAKPTASQPAANPVPKNKPMPGKRPLAKKRP